MKIVDALKPCPFCGCRAILVEVGFISIVVRCPTCEVRTIKCSSKEEARKKWNRRAS